MHKGRLFNVRSCHGRPHLAFVVLLASCGGNASTPGGGDGGGGEGGRGGGAGGVTSAECKERQASHSRLRRLNRVEFDNTIADLFADESRYAASFPAEPSPHGFDNDTLSLAVTPELAELQWQTTAKIADKAVRDKIDALLCGCKPASDGEDKCLTRFFAEFGKRIYRRPLQADDIAPLREAFMAGKANGFGNGLRLALTAMLNSPQFLYRVELGQPVEGDASYTQPTDWEMATRLSYLVWRSTPDAELLAAAEKGELRTAEQLKRQVDRMLQNKHARNMVSDFHRQWLGLDQVLAVRKDPVAYPDFNDDIARAMQAEAIAFTSDVFWEKQGTMADLFRSKQSFVNGKLAKYYGEGTVTGDEAKPIEFTKQPRSGILTRGALLARLAKPNQTHPIQRGKFVREHLLCETVPLPGGGVIIEFPPLSDTLTTRERFTQHRDNPDCRGCHELLDPVGLPFEQYDGAGKYRTKENNRDIDVSGYLDDGDVKKEFQGVEGLSEILADMPQAKSCFAQQWFRFAFGRSADGEADGCALAAIEAHLADDNVRMQDMLSWIVQTDAFALMSKPEQKADK